MLHAVATPHAAPPATAEPQPPRWFIGHQRNVLVNGLAACAAGGPAACAALLDAWREDRAQPAASDDEVPDGISLAVAGSPTLHAEIEAAAAAVRLPRWRARAWRPEQVGALWRGALAGLDDEQRVLAIAEVAGLPEAPLGLLDGPEAPPRWELALAVVERLDAAFAWAAIELFVDAATTLLGPPPPGRLRDLAAAMLRAGAASAWLRVRLRVHAPPELPTADETPQPRPDDELDRVQQLSGDPVQHRATAATIALRALREAGVPHTPVHAALAGVDAPLTTATAYMRLLLAGAAPAPARLTAVVPAGLWASAARCPAAQRAAALERAADVDPNLPSPLHSALQALAPDTPARAAVEAWRAAPPALPPDASALEAWAESSAAFALDPTPTRLAAGVRAMAALREIDGWDAALADDSIWSALFPQRDLLEELALRGRGPAHLRAVAAEVEAGAWGGTADWRPLHTDPSSQVGAGAERYAPGTPAALRAGERLPLAERYIPEADAHIADPAYTAGILQAAAAARGSVWGARLEERALQRLLYRWARHDDLSGPENDLACALAERYPEVALRRAFPESAEVEALRAALAERHGADGLRLARERRSLSEAVRGVDEAPLTQAELSTLREAAEDLRFAHAIAPSLRADAAFDEAGAGATAQPTAALLLARLLTGPMPAEEIIAALGALRAAHSHGPCVVAALHAGCARTDPRHHAALRAAARAHLSDPTVALSGATASPHATRVPSGRADPAGFARFAAPTSS